MKIQCPACKETVEVTTFASSDAGLRLTCPACQRASFVPSQPTTAPSAQPMQAARSRSSSNAAAIIVVVLCIGFGLLALLIAAAVLFVVYGAKSLAV